MVSGKLWCRRAWAARFVLPKRRVRLRGKGGNFQETNEPGNVCSRIGTGASFFIIVFCHRKGSPAPFILGPTMKLTVNASCNATLRASVPPSPAISLKPSRAFSIVSSGSTTSVSEAVYSFRLLEALRSGECLVSARLSSSPETHPSISQATKPLCTPSCLRSTNPRAGR